MTEGGRSPKVRKSGSPKGKKKPEIGGPKSEEENTSTPDSYRDDIPHAEINKSELIKSDPDSYRDEHPTFEIQELPTTNSKLQTENMEVHHHPEVEKKGFKAYLLEGLMIFLAVTLGFFAENLRETISNNQHENELAKALYTELSADSIAAAQIFQIRLMKEKDLDYLYAYFKDSSLTVLPRRFYPAYTIGLFMINSNTFEPKDGILSQLKTSGGIQYFKSAALQKLLGDLNVSINNIRYRNEQEYQFFAAPIKPFLLRYYDFNWLDKVRIAIPKGNLIDLINFYLQSTLNIKGSILNTRSFDRGEAANMALFNKQMLVATRSLQLNNYIIINHKILQVLRKTYTLE